MSGAAIRKVEYFGKTPIHVRTYPTSKDPDTATGQTIAVMCRMIRGAQANPIIRGISQQLAYQSQDCDWFGKAATVFQWMASHVEFTPDDPILTKVLGFHDALDMLIDPALLVSMPRPAGDCDDFTDLGATLLSNLGFPVELVAIAANPEQPRIWSHVYLQIALDSGRRMAVDFSHGPYPGWEAPRYYRRRVWTLDGQIVNAPAPIAVTISQPQPQEVPPMLGFSGFGDPATDAEDAIASTIDQIGSFDPFNYLSGVESNIALTSNDNPDLIPLPASTGTTAAGIFSTIANDATSITQTLLNLPRSGEYVATGPGGTVRSYNVPGASPTGISLGGTTLSSGTILLGLAAVAALFMFSGKH